MSNTLSALQAEPAGQHDAPHVASFDINKERALFVARFPGYLPGYWTERQEQEFAVWLAARELDAPELFPAPVWVSVAKRLPEPGVLVLVYSPNTVHDWPDSIRIEFDCIDPEADDPVWLAHSEHYEHYCCVAKPEGSVGPSAEAPYTHWMPLPPVPA